MKPDYYITGAGGFIGKHLVKYLKDRGEEVVTSSCLLRYETPAIIINLAAYGNHHFQTNSREIIKANVLDLKKLLYFRPLDSVVKFYNISTSSVTLPVQTVYSASKLLGETLVNSLNDPRFVNIRPYSVYGPGEADHRFIPTVIRHLKSGERMELDPLPVHDWIHVEDFIKAMFDGYTEIGTGLTYSNMQIVEMLELISGKKLNWIEKKMRVYDNYRWVCPNGVPHRYIYEGLKQTWEAAL